MEPRAPPFFLAHIFPSKGSYKNTTSFVGESPYRKLFTQKLEKRRLNKKSYVVSPLVFSYRFWGIFLHGSSKTPKPHYILLQVRRFFFFFFATPCRVWYLVPGFGFDFALQFTAQRNSNSLFTHLIPDRHVARQG
jgi:hypothetical protein